MEMEKDTPSTLLPFQEMIPTWQDLPKEYKEDISFFWILWALSYVRGTDRWPTHLVVKKDLNLDGPIGGNLGAKTMP